MQLEELLLDEPENQDYQSLYSDVQEVRRRTMHSLVLKCIIDCPSCLTVSLCGVKRLHCSLPSAGCALAALLGRNH